MYKDFVEHIDIKRIENPNNHVAEGFILGNADFIHWVKETFLSERKEEKEIPQLKKLKPKVKPDKVVQAVCQEFSCNSGQVTTKGRKKNKAREVAIYLARDMSGLSGKDLGMYFGGVSGALITIMYNRTAQEMTQNRRLRNKIERIKQNI